VLLSIGMNDRKEGNATYKKNNNKKKERKEEAKAVRGPQTVLGQLY
jgi:hypothetical protein